MSFNEDRLARTKGKKKGQRVHRILAAANRQGGGSILKCWKTEPC